MKGALAGDFYCWKPPKAVTTGRSEHTMFGLPVKFV